LLGAIIGAMAGAVAGILFAPAPGEVSRAKLKKKAKELKNKAGEVYKEMEPMIDKAKEQVLDPLMKDVNEMDFVKKAKVKMAEINEDGLANTVKEAVEPIKDKLKGDVSLFEKAPTSGASKKAKKTFFRRS